MKVLIAEDDLTTRTILKENIQKWGYKTIVARNGKEAWNALGKNTLRLAVLDWMMPGIDGVKICRKIRKTKKSKYVYIILVSSRDHTEDIVKGLSSGADDYMTKPFNLVELRLRLQTGRRIIRLEDNLLKAKKKYQRLASYDNLTSLWNRDKILEFLTEELERGSRENIPTGIIIVDIDRFKKINDHYGHAAGDAVLVEIASRLRKSLRRYDKVGRYGGDEMLIILPNCNSGMVKTVGERIRSTIISKKIKWQQNSLGLTVSMGAASSDSLLHATADNLIQASDEALYLAKKRGRNLLLLFQNP